MWELTETFKPLLLPSLEVHCKQLAEERNVQTRVIALELLIDSRCHEDEFDEEELRQKYKDWDWWQLLPLIAERVESMTFGANAFVIDKGGWTTVKTCSHDQMIEYYS